MKRQKNKSALVLLLALVLATMSVPSPAYAGDTVPPTVAILSPSSGSVISSSGEILLSGQAQGWTKIRDAINVCDLTTSNCMWSLKEYDGDACRPTHGFRTELEFNLPAYSSLVGQLKRDSSTSASYSIDKPGTYRIWYSSVEYGAGVLWPADNCKRTETFVDVTVRVQTLTASSPTFMAEANGINLYMDESYSACGFGNGFTFVVPGQRVECSVKIEANPTALGSVPITFFQQVSGGKKVKIGTAEATIGKQLLKSFTIPNQVGKKVTYSAQVTPLPNTWLELENMTITSPSLPLNVKITGPSKVIRGKTFSLTFKSTPKVSGTCILTSHPEASGWGDLGTIKLVNGAASKSVKLYWPLRLGDGFTVGVSVKCAIGNRNAFNTFGAMGYIP